MDADDDADEWPMLDADTLYGFAGEFVSTIEPHTEADSVSLLLTFLVAVGNVIGRSARYAVGGDDHHANIFVSLVGASSRARKGTSLGCVLDVFKGVDDSWTKRRVSGLSSGEGVIAAVRDADVSENGGTFNVHGPDKRLWVTETEFGQTLRVLKREGNTLSPVIRNAWDRGEMHVLTRANPLRASGAHVSIVAHITRPELGKYLDETDVWNGLANRFLWALVRRSKLLPDGGTLPVDELRERLRSIVENASRIGTMKRSAEAMALWNDLYPSLVAEKRGIWDAVTSRGEAQTLRLSMLYALLDGSDTIHVQHLRAAHALWRYCDDSARIIFGGDDDGGTLERKVRRIVSERPGILRNELHKAISHKLTADRFDAVLAWLVGRNEIVCVHVHEGRQADRYYRGTGTPTGTESSPRSGGVSDVSPAGTQGRRDVGVPEAVVSPASDAVNASTSPTSLRLPTIVAGDADACVPYVPTSPMPEDGTETACVPTSPSPATMVALIEWKNATGASFVRRGDSVWVTQENGLTPALREAIKVNQEMLRAFVSTDDDVSVEAVANVHEDHGIEVELDEITLSSEASAFFAELLAMESARSTA